MKTHPTTHHKYFVVKTKLVLSIIGVLIDSGISIKEMKRLVNGRCSCVSP